MKKKKILVVDDDRDSTATIQFSLEEEGFECDIAYDGQTALDKVKASPPDLIVLDLKLGEIGGYQVCEALKEDPNLQTIPIIMLTAMNSELCRLSGIMAGASAYITKPFEMKELIQRIRNALESEEARQKMLKDFWKMVEMSRVKKREK